MNAFPVEAIANLIAFVLACLVIMFLFLFFAGDIVQDMAKPPRKNIAANKIMGYPHWWVYRWWWKKTTFTSCIGGCVYILFLPILATILIVVNVVLLDCRFAMPICR